MNKNCDISNMSHHWTSPPYPPPSFHIAGASTQQLASFHYFPNCPYPPPDILRQNVRPHGFHGGSLPPSQFAFPFTLPPPPLPTASPSSFIPEPHITNALARIQIKLPSQASPPILKMSIPEYRSLLAKTIKNREAYRHLLDEIGNADSPDKTAKQTQADELQAILLKNQDILQLNKPKILQNLQRNAKKRTRNRNNRVHSENAMATLAARRREAHERCDTWLLARQKVHRARLHQRERARHTRLVLADVRRRKAEVQELLQRVQALSTLRQLRWDVAQHEGRLVPEGAAEVYQAEVTALLNLLTAQLQRLQEEEDRRKELLLLSDEKTATSMKEKLMKVELWEKLFGSESSGVNVPIDNRHARFYNQGVLELEAFIKIRSQWDAYLSDQDGTVLPPGWVIPTEPTSNQWEKYLQ